MYAFANPWFPRRFALLICVVGFMPRALLFATVPADTAYADAAIIQTHIAPKVLKICFIETSLLGHILSHINTKGNICFIVDFDFFTGTIRNMILVNEVLNEISDNLIAIRGFL
jgi:hypothetical protein